MAIDINKLSGVNNTRSRTAVGESNQAPKSTDTQPAASGNKPDSVNITPQAQQLQGAHSKMASMPEVDVQKVAEIKQAIAEGRYKVDAEKLASNIAQFEQELQDLNN
ncbi:flagellar biosynthesis anti-sigma factor FlgM [Shewanella corallii]|uniref:Negative regulator of flagellin synthesis n=2 Tax=Shewanella TaxID=22 RepID=A0ABT0N3V1_9GAMM|nr:MULTISPECIES: flagellar biosynthesis anti-sigma factor FlgM [Shewanella]MCL1036472.1 flagellar biosynthesis anti-sigma factor FlgM [Shewanella submarina]MCL2913103.1 flagellar biosynthesis anti-sigma factor FlgM [Shewanella corallii]